MFLLMMRNANRTIYEMKIEKADTFKIFFYRTVAITGPKEQMRTLLKIVDKNAKEKVLLIETTVMISFLPVCGCLINRLYYSPKIARSTKWLQ